MTIDETVKIRLKLNGAILYGRKVVLTFSGRYWYDLVPHFCMYCGHEGLEHTQGWPTYHCPMCGQGQDEDDTQPEVNGTDCEEATEK